MGSFKRVLVLSMILVSCFATVAFASAFRIGDQGSEVAEIQGQLASLGYDVAADGDFGPATAEAIKSFQSSRTSSIFFMMEIPYSTENVGRYAEVPRKSLFPRCNSQMLKSSLSSG